MQEAQRRRLIGGSGLLFRRQRERMRLTQAEAARAVGVSRNTVARWERGAILCRRHWLTALEAYQSPAGDTSIDDDAFWLVGADAR